MNDPSSDESTHRRLEKSNLYFLIFLLAVSAIGFIYIVRFFFIPVLLALALSVLFYPFYEWLLRGMGSRRNLAAALACLILFLGLMIPLFLIGYLLFTQLAGLIQYLESQNVFQESTLRGILQAIQESQINAWLQRLGIDWLGALQQLLGGLGGFLTTVVNRTATGVISLVTNLFILLFTLFYFFRDGPGIMRQILFLSPLRDEYERMLIARFVSINRATLVGTLVVGLVHGAIGALTLLFFGVSTWLVWGVVIVILAFIPILGPWLVLVPVGIVQIASGQLGAGIVTILIGTVLISIVDNLLRPRLVGHSARMHDLLILFSTLGGITVFGIIGFIIGPLIAAFFVTFLSIYGMEFRAPLSASVGLQEGESGSGGGVSPPGRKPPARRLKGGKV